jgi:hypothetical protein
MAKIKTIPVLLNFTNNDDAANFMRWFNNKGKDLYNEHREDHKEDQISFQPDFDYYVFTQE